MSKFGLDQRCGLTEIKKTLTDYCIRNTDLLCGFLYHLFHVLQALILEGITFSKDNSACRHKPKGVGSVNVSRYFNLKENSLPQPSHDMMYVPHMLPA